MTSPLRPAERPNGSFVKHTRTGFGARPMVSILVREDDPRNPDTPQRWRSVEGRGGWFTWEQLHATGTVEPLFTSAEVAAAAASRQQPRQAIVQTAGAQWSRDQYHWRAAAVGRPRRGDLPQPGKAGNPPATSTGTPPPQHGPAARDLGGPRR